MKINKENVTKPAIIVVAGILVAVGIYFYFNEKTKNSSQLQITDERLNEVVATVNGEEINGSEFDVQLDRIKTAYAQQGADVTDPQLMSQVETQILDQLIASVLLRQAAENSGIQVTDDEVQAEIDKIIFDMGGEEVFNQELESANMTRDFLNNEIRTQLLITKYLDVEVYDIEREISTEEAQAFYDEINATQELPAFEEIEEMIKSQLLQQEQALQIQERIETLKSESDIQINL